MKRAKTLFYVIPRAGRESRKMKSKKPLDPPVKPEDAG